MPEEWGPIPENDRGRVCNPCGSGLKEKNGFLLCQYSLKHFSGAAIMMAAETHRETI